MAMVVEERDIEEILDFPDRVKAFDPAATREAAKLYFDMNNLPVAYLRPEYEE